MTNLSRGALPVVLKVCILALAFFLGILYINPGHLWGDDFALYLHQAEAMLDGEMYELYAQNSHAMRVQFIGPDIYPPGYPALLALFKLAGAREMLTLKILNWGCFLLLAVLAFRFIKLKTGKEWVSLLVIGFFLLNPQLLRFSDQLISDLFFTGLIIVFYFFLYNAGYRSPGKMVILSLLIFAASITKTQGVLLIFPFSLSLFYYRNVHKNGSFIWYFVKQHILIILLLCTYLFVYPFHDNQHAAQMLRLTPAQLLHNFKSYIVLGGDFLSFGTTFWAGTLLNGLLVIPAVWYFITHLRKELLVLAWMIPLTVLLVLWPFPTGHRFYFTVELFLLYGTIMFIRALNRTWLEKVVFGSMALLMIGANVRQLSANRDDPMDDPFSPSSVELYQFIVHHISHDATVYYWKPRLLSWQTQRNSIGYPQDPGKIDHRKGIIVIDKTRKYRIPGSFDAATSHRILIFQSEKYEVWKLGNNPTPAAR